MGVAVAITTGGVARSTLSRGVADGRTATTEACVTGCGLWCGEGVAPGLVDALGVGEFDGDADGDGVDDGRAEGDALVLGDVVTEGTGVADASSELGVAKPGVARAIAGVFAGCCPGPPPKKCANNAPKSSPAKMTTNTSGIKGSPP